MVADTNPVSVSLPNSLEFTVPRDIRGSVGFVNEGYWGNNDGISVENGPNTLSQASKSTRLGPMMRLSITDSCLPLDSLLHSPLAYAQVLAKSLLQKKSQSEAPRWDGPKSMCS